MYQFERYVELSQQANSVDDLRRLFTAAAQQEGYENFLLTSVRGRDVIDLHWLEFPEGYPEYYFDQQWDKIDPILGCALRARRPFLWNDALQGADLSRPQINLMHECQCAGVHTGVTFPMHGPGNQLDILSLSRRVAEPANPERIGLMHSLSVQTWTRFLELTEEQRFPENDDVMLSRREIEVLKWCKAGKPYSDIGEILSISRKTVEFHAKNAMDKLGASNKISAVVMAIQRGFLEL